MIIENDDDIKLLSELFDYFMDDCEECGVSKDVPIMRERIAKSIHMKNDKYLFKICEEL